MANTETQPAQSAQSAMTQSEEDLDIEEYKDKTKEFFERIIKKIEKVIEVIEQVNKKIEIALVTNIKSDISVVKDLVLEFCTQDYMKVYVKGKVECIEKDVEKIADDLKNKKRGKKEGEEKGKDEGEKNGKEEAGRGKIEEKKTEVEVDDERRKGAKKLKTSEWLIAIAKKTEKIKKLVSQFGSLPDEDDEAGAMSSTSKKKEQKSVSDNTGCHYMCVEESLLISPMMDSLKKSYHHLPSELRLSLLSLAAFPEDFIIKKRPLIYWWMAEGFVDTKLQSSSMSAEEVGEQNFTQLIKLGLIQPWYEGNIEQPHVQGCRVHPWIRRMLVSVAMEAQLFEFFGINNEEEHPHPENTPSRSRRVCLYDDGEGVDHTASWKTRNRKYVKLRERLKWINAQALNREKNKKAQHDKKEMPEMPKDLKQVSDRQKMFKYLTDLNNLVAEVTHGKTNLNPSDDHDALTAFNHRLSALTARIDAMTQKNNDVGNSGDMQNILNELHGEQMKLLNDIDEELHKQVQGQLSCLERLFHPAWVNDPVVYSRVKNCETLQKEEQLFSNNDLNNQFPFPMMKKRTKDAAGNKTIDAYDVHMEKLLAIINVRQSYLSMDTKLQEWSEWFGKMKKLRVLHLGRWQDSFPIPHIEVGNTRFLEALFREAKHLKYLSLRGISRITDLPKSISRCTSLQILDLKACYNLERLPSQIASLYKLTHLDVSECYLLQNTDLWSIVAKLELLQTLKGLRVENPSHTSKIESLLATHKKLRKLSITLTDTTLQIDLSNIIKAGNLHLCVLSITWRTKTEFQGSDPNSQNASQQKQGIISDSGGDTLSQQQPEKSEVDANNTDTPTKQQPEKSEVDANNIETPSQQQPEASNGGANTENLAQKEPEKGNVDASTGNRTEKQLERRSKVKGIETLSHLKKLDLRCYPYQTWPDWLKKHHDSLETLYITGGNLKEFPMDQLAELPNLQVLRFKYLRHLELAKDFNEQLKTKYPSINYLNINSPN